MSSSENPLNNDFTCQAQMAEPIRSDDGPSVAALQQRARVLQRMASEATERINNANQPASEAEGPTTRMRKRTTAALGAQAAATAATGVASAQML